MIKNVSSEDEEERVRIESHEKDLLGMEERILIGVQRKGK